MNDTSAFETAGAVDQLDDAALVAEAQRGDCAAMDQLVARHFRYVDTLCRRMMYNAQDAEDARQDALFQAARRISTFQGRATFRTWLHTIATNICLNKIRAQSRLRETTLDDERDAVRPHRRDPRQIAQRDDVETRLDIEAALALISPTFRDPLVLWFICDYSYEDISNVLGVKVDTVKSRLFRGKKQLAALLREPP